MRLSRHFFRLLIGTIFLVTGVSSTFAIDIDTIEIRVLPESVVYGEYYVLGDIAEMDGFDVELIQKLAKAQIGKSPLPGKSYLLTRGQIENRLRNKAPDHKIKLVMPERPMISRAAIKITKEQLKDVVLAEVKKDFEGYDDINIIVTTKLRDVFIPKGNVSYQVSRVGKSLKIGGYSSWMFTLMLDEKPIKKIVVRIKAQVFDKVVVAKGQIPKGTKIDETDLVTMKKNISQERLGYESTPDLVVGEFARRDIFVNETLNPNLVEQPVIITKGARVKIVYKTSSVYFSNIAIAMKSGRKGDLIPLRTLKSKKTIYAVIKDSKNAEIPL